MLSRGIRGCPDDDGYMVTRQRSVTGQNPFARPMSDGFVHGVSHYADGFQLLALNWTKSTTG